MSDTQNTVAETGADDAAFRDINAIIDGSPADEPARGNLNGSDFIYERNVVHTMPQVHYDIVEGAGYPIRHATGADLSSPDTAPAEDGAALTETDVSNGGDGGDLAAGGANSTVEPNPILDGNVADVIATLPGLTRDELTALLAAEQAGKTRVTLVAAIEAALAGAA